MLPDSASSVAKRTFDKLCVERPFGVDVTQLVTGGRLEDVAVAFELKKAASSRSC